MDSDKIFSTVVEIMNDLGWQLKAARSDNDVNNPVFKKHIELNLQLTALSSNLENMTKEQIKEIVIWSATKTIEPMGVGLIDVCLRNDYPNMGMESVDK